MAPDIKFRNWEARLGVSLTEASNQLDRFKDLFDSAPLEVKYRVVAMVSRFMLGNEESLMIAGNYIDNIADEDIPQDYDREKHLDELLKSVPAIKEKDKIEKMVEQIFYPQANLSEPQKIFFDTRELTEKINTIDSSDPTLGLILRMLEMFTKELKGKIQSGG